MNNKNGVHWAAFTDWLIERDAAPRTREAYLRDVMLFVAWFEQTTGQPFTPDRLTGARTIAYRGHLRQERGVAASTWNRKLASLRLFATWAVGQGYLHHNPLEGVRGIEKTGSDQPRWFEYAERLEILDYYENQIHITAGRAQQARRKQAVQNQAMIYLMLKAGLRPGELVTLNEGDLHLTKRGAGSFITVREGKGLKERRIPLGRDVRGKMWLYLDSLEMAHLPDTALFKSQQSGRYNRVQGSRVFQPCRDALRLMEGHKPATAHCLRHTFARSLVEAGVGLEKIQQLLGHASIETTMRYVTPSAADLAAAVEDL